MNTLEHPYNVNLLSNKKEQTTDTDDNMEELQKHDDDERELTPREHSVCIFIQSSRTGKPNIR